jgi:hypothetical protein
MKLHPIPPSAGHILILLLLVCAVCIAPVMATTQTEVVEDGGVHLIKFDDSPTILDDQYYRMKPNVDFVVDGDQYYWVRIGNVKAEGLTTVWWSVWVALALTLVAFVAFLLMWCWIFPRISPKTFAQCTTLTIGDFGPPGGRWAELKRQLPFVFPILCGIALAYCVHSSGALSSAITHAACGDYMDIQASDGTILLNVDKLHPETNTLYMKSGLNLTTLTHIPRSGTSIQNYGVSPP